MEKHFICNFHLELKDHQATDYHHEHEQRVLKNPIYTTSRSRIDFKINHPLKGHKDLIRFSKGLAKKLRNRRQILKNQKDLNTNRQPGTNGIREHCGQYGLLEGKRR